MHITLISSVKSPIKPEDQLSADWDGIAEYLCCLHPSLTKDTTPMFNLWQMKTLEEGAEEARKYKWDPIRKVSDKSSWTYKSGTIRRCANNTVGLWGLVLDYDGRKTIEEAVIELDGIECVFYTTFRHSNELPKFRVILPFSRMMTKDEFALKINSMKAKFPDADNASFSESQAIYLHSANDHAVAMSFRMHGDMVSPDSFPDQIIAPIQPAPPVVCNSLNFDVDDKFRDDYAEAMYNSLITCRDVHRPASKADPGAMGIALLCKSAGLEYGVFQEIVKHACDPKSVMQDELGQFVVWNDVTNNRVTKKYRDKFIGLHGGIPFKLIRKDKVIYGLEAEIAKLKQLINKE